MSYDQYFHYIIFVDQLFSRNWLDGIISIYKIYQKIKIKICVEHVIIYLYDLCYVQISYIIEKGVFKRSGTNDVCNLLEHKSNTFEMKLELLGLPKQCPIKKVGPLIHG